MNLNNDSKMILKANYARVFSIFFAILCRISEQESRGFAPFIALLDGMCKASASHQVLSARFTFLFSIYPSDDDRRL